MTTGPLDALPIILSYSGGPNGPGRRKRSQVIDLIVIHTNESSSESAAGAEGLAQYTAAPHPSDYPAYHVLVDSDSAVRTAFDDDRVNGAGGVAERAWHLCLYGTAHQTAAEWNDLYSKAELVIAAGLVREACERFSIPMTKIGAAQVAANVPGVCAHADVSAVYPASQGHTDPGPEFPWDKFMNLVAAPPVPSVADLLKLQQLIEENSVEHGMAVSAATVAEGVLVLDRWGGVSYAHQVGTVKKRINVEKYANAQDIAREIVVVTGLVKGEKITGYVLDLRGALWRFAEAGATFPPALADVPYWASGKIVAATEI
jgi:hypothetical protein